MPRNAEVIRQWKLVLHLDGLAHGRTVDALAQDLSVTKRTIWRDVAALQEVGFPLVDEKRDRKTVWKMMRLPFKALNDSGLSVTEVCSLHMSRTLLLSLTGTPFEDGLNSLLKKVQKALSPRTRAFLDELPMVLRVRADPRKKVSAGYNELVATLIEAAARRRVVRMRYFSVSSNRVKDYIVHPYVVVYSDGGLYLQAYVPEYDEVRLFAAERVKKCRATEDGFTPVPAFADADLEPSLGMGNGKPERVALEFSSRVAPYVRERVWHASQQLHDLSDGGVRLVMKVARDWALHGWVLSWGAHVHVVAPPALATDILAMLDGARDWYMPKLDFGQAFSSAGSSGAPYLPHLGRARPSKPRSAAIS